MVNGEKGLPEGVLPGPGLQCDCDVSGPHAKWVVVIKCEK